MVHVPEFATMVTTPPLTVHTDGVLEVYVTPNVEVAVAGKVYGESVLLMVAGNTKLMVCGIPTEMLSMYIVAPEFVPPDWSNVPFTNTNRYVDDVAGMVIREFCQPDTNLPVASTISVWVQVDVSSK